MVRGRRVVIVRHGERVDFTFNDEWIKICFSDDNTYIRHNLNMPDEVPKREGSPQVFLRDCPLTQTGVHQATLIGKGLAEDRILQDGFEVYVSPALRCVQTATSILKGMEKNQILKVEPCLFEWTKWFEHDMPTWMSSEEYKENNFNVDPTYVPFMAASEVRDPGLEEYYERSFRLVQHLIASTDKDLLLIAHGASLHTLTRQLTGGSIPSKKDMMNILHKVPYCGIAVVEKYQDVDQWRLISVPRMSLRHAESRDFDASKIFAMNPGL